MDGAPSPGCQPGGMTQFWGLTGRLLAVVVLSPSAWPSLAEPRRALELR
jgi:hypothetical protein